MKILKFKRPKLTDDELRVKAREQLHAKWASMTDEQRARWGEMPPPTLRH